MVFPELWVVILLRGSDASLKQSINKSAVELISLPLPFQLKRKTKSFIDVVVDSLATGIAGCLLIFFVKGLDVAPKYLMVLILSLTMVWAFFVFLLRKQYFLSFRKNLENLTNVKTRKKLILSEESFLNGMLRVFKEGSENEILFMLGKALEIKDNRLESAISNLLSHPSNKIKIAALHNLYYITKGVIHLEVKDLLFTKDKDLVIAALEYILLHADTNESIVFDKYLDHENVFISHAALICLAKETRDNQKLKTKYLLDSRIKLLIAENESNNQISVDLLQIIGLADYKEGYNLIIDGINSPDPIVQSAAIAAAGHTMNGSFVDLLLEKLIDKNLRDVTIKSLMFYGNSLLSVLFAKINGDDISKLAKNMIPKVMESYKSQEAVNMLIDCFINAEDLSVRLECVASLSNLKEENSSLHFNQVLIAKLILEECKLYNNTIDVMHAQIIVHYLRRKRNKIADDQMLAREGLLDLLERRLENGLKRIFKLLELKFAQSDIRLIYKGIISKEPENVTNAIEFLDLLLNPNLKNALIPIIEASVLDLTSDDVIDSISKNRLSELECFRSILEGKDVKLKMAVLYLVSKTEDIKYLEILLPFQESKDKRIKDYIKNTIYLLQQPTK